ncbi:MAG: thiamine-binding protein [Saprospiraceae bacterium]|nr:thiamine-binding protein [Saprospiraceae bacterium]
MQITVEISFYPLHQSFGSQILEFVRYLQGHSELEVKTNSMSTQISGDFDTVMERVTSALKQGFSSEIKTVAVMKIFNEGLQLEWLNLSL